MNRTQKEEEEFQKKEAQRQRQTSQRSQTKWVKKSDAEKIKQEQIDLVKQKLRERELEQKRLSEEKLAVEQAERAIKERITLEKKKEKEQIVSQRKMEKEKALEPSNEEKEQIDREKTITGIIKMFLRNKELSLSMIKCGLLKFSYLTRCELRSVVNSQHSYNDDKRTDIEVDRVIYFFKKTIRERGLDYYDVDNNFLAIGKGNNISLVLNDNTNVFDKKKFIRDNSVFFEESKGRRPEKTRLPSIKIVINKRFSMFQNSSFIFINYFPIGTSRKIILEKGNQLKEKIKKCLGSTTKVSIEPIQKLNIKERVQKYFSGRIGDYHEQLKLFAEDLELYWLQDSKIYDMLKSDLSDEEKTFLSNFWENIIVNHEMINVGIDSFGMNRHSIEKQLLNIFNDGSINEQEKKDMYLSIFEMLKGLRSLAVRGIVRDSMDSMSNGLIPDLTNIVLEYENEDKIEDNEEIDQGNYETSEHSDYDTDDEYHYYDDYDD